MEMERYNPVTNLMEEVKTKDAANSMVHIKFKKKNKKTGSVQENSGWYNSEQSFLKEEGANSAFEIVDYTVSGKTKDSEGTAKDAMELYLVTFKKNNQKNVQPVFMTAASPKEAKEMVKRKYSENGYHNIVIKSVTLANSIGNKDSEGLAKDAELTGGKF